MSRAYIFLRGLSLWQISDLKRHSDGLRRPKGEVKIYNSEIMKLLNFQLIQKSSQWKIL